MAELTSLPLPTPRLNVLIVEDSEDDALLLASHLSEAGYELMWHCVDNREALEASLSDQDWDIVFSDYSMPHFRGDQALEIIRRHDPDLPFIFVSGTIGEEAAVASMRAGAQDYVMKNDLNRLIPAVRRELSEACVRRERHRVESELRKLSKAVEQTADSVFITDQYGHIEYVNPAFEQLSGYCAEEVLGYTPALFKYERNSPEYFQHMWKVLQSGEVFRDTLINRRKDGTLFYEEKTITPLTQNDGQISHFISTGRDVSERQKYEEELRHQATHDSLTGLPNRTLLADRLEAEIRRATRNDERFALLFLDLDNFKRVNDSLGHAAGDCLLREFARRLRDCLRPNDTVARYGGDEFVVVSGNLASIDHVLVVLAKLRNSCEAAIRVNGHEVYATFSVGIALYPTDGQSEESLLKNADTAMYRAKTLGRNQYQFYAPDMNARSRELLDMETSLKQALARGEFQIHYQPQTALRSGRVVGCEALLRWQRQGQLITPDDFVPLLEETGLIQSVGEWVLRHACEQWRTHQTPGQQAPRIAVNVSARQFQDHGLVDMVAQVLRDEAMQADALELEITESTVMQDVHLAEDILAALKGLGVRLTVDDFGTGYSSLAYLKRFPLDVLKIDAAFIRDLPHDADDVAITQASISLGHSLGLEVLAEGVETRAQYEFLRARGCDCVQGYFISRPLPVEQAVAFVDANQNY